MRLAQHDYVSVATDVYRSAGSASISITVEASP
jgi:hypothetical protein